MDCVLFYHNIQFIFMLFVSISELFISFSNCSVSFLDCLLLFFRMKRSSFNLLLECFFILFPSITLSFYITTTQRPTTGEYPGPQFYDWLSKYLLENKGKAAKNFPSYDDGATVGYHFKTKKTDQGKMPFERPVLHRKNTLPITISNIRTNNKEDFVIVSKLEDRNVSSLYNKLSKPIQRLLSSPKINKRKLHYLYLKK